MNRDDNKFFVEDVSGSRPTPHGVISTNGIDSKRGTGGHNYGPMLGENGVEERAEHVHSCRGSRLKTIDPIYDESIQKEM